MNERKPSTMLQRLPVILAVTAASYGLQLPPSVGRTSSVGKSAAISQPVAGNASVQAGKRARA